MADCRLNFLSSQFLNAGLLGCDRMNVVLDGGLVGFYIDWFYDFLFYGYFVGF